MKPSFAFRLIWLCALMVTAPFAVGAELHVMTSGTFTAAYLELKPIFERATGHTLVTDATSMGAGQTTIPRRVERGERADVLIMDANALAQMIRGGLVLADSRTDLVRTTIGMAVRKGAPVPDISTLEALKRALLAATSIGLSSSVSGDYFANELFSRLGIAAEVKAKTRRIEVERVGLVVARGEVEIGFQQMSELLPIAGITIAGPLPPGAQLTSTFAAGVPTASPHPTEARAFISFLASEAAAEAIRKSGLEAIGPRGATEKR
jgi:molybdate transport system substrate-binding protein